ncbi:hypothetical protein WA026_018542 [Henosepilachna vigintioctopunctata]|uniref:RING-type domain-containing protein n=1 Tax=Henosepilachna vigintioctopunctata TaxID=420089 RepID=A0AAW1U9P9_9CUCU
MEINCIICSDLFTQSSEMVVNQCGHMFHHACLLQWMERSKTCPQCRSRATEKSVYKVFFNFLNTDHITDDIGTLQAKLDGANFKLHLKKHELTELYEKFDLREAQNLQLRQLVANLEQKIGSLESNTHALKEKLSFFKSKAKDSERLQSEVNSLKENLKDVQKVETALYGTRAEVNEILKNETNIEALALLSATLKKTLIDVERKNNVLQSRLKHALNDITKYKRESSSFEATNTELRKLLNDNKKSWEEEKSYLKQKIEQLNKDLNEKKEKSSERLDDSIQRIMTESPAPLPRRKVDLKRNHLEAKPSPTVAEQVINLMDSDSPYLNVKTNYTTIFGTKYTKIGQKKSIFKSATKVEDISKPSTSQTVYTGLGGQVQEDFYKFPEKKSLQVGIKRQKSSSYVPSNKYRKLAALSASKKITDFVSLDDTL